MWEKCKNIQQELVEIRRDLHKIPEFGSDLPKTKAYVISKLNEWGIPYVENKGDSGVIATIKGGKEGKTVAFRADMDALLIREANPVDYISTHDGKMHACGHDAHTTMLLGAAKVFSENKEKLAGTVKLIFQADEENSTGALCAIREGCLKGVDAIFGTHIGSIISKDIPAGKVIITPGRVMASNDRFVIRVKGFGCHGSTPEKGVDPVNVASHIVLNLQEVVTREIAATRPHVMTIGLIQAGDTYNIIPSECLVEGTMRTLEEEVRQYMAKRICEIAKATAATYRAKAECEIVWGVPPVVNHADMAELVKECAVEVVGKDMVIDEVAAPNMGSEDFSYYVEKIPGAFMFLSSANPEKGTDVPHHNAKFNIDEDVLWTGSAMFVKIAEKFLGTV